MPVKPISLLSIAVLALALTGSAAVRGETLNQALIATLKSNPMLAAARADQSAAEHDVRAAQGGWYPTLGLTGSLARDHTQGTITFFNSPESFNADLNQAMIALRVDQPIWEGGRLSSNVSAAKYAAQASRAHTQARTAGVFLNAVKAYLDVVMAEKLLQVQKENVAVINRQKEAAEAALKHGEGTKTDVAQADSRLQGAIAQRIRAEAGLAQTRALYRAVIGHAPVGLTLPTTLPQLPATLVAARNSARQDYTVQTAHFNADAASAQAERADSAVLPKLGLFAEVRRAREPQYGFDELNDTMIGVTLSVPIWEGGSLRAERASAHDRARAARHQAQASEDRAVRRVVSAWQDYGAAQASLKAIEAQLAAARVAYDGVDAEYRRGERTLLDALNAEQEVRNAEAALIEARRDRIVAAYALLAVTGKLTPKALGLPVVGTKTSTP